MMNTQLSAASCAKPLFLHLSPQKKTSLFHEDTNDNGVKKKRNAAVKKVRFVGV